MPIDEHTFCRGRLREVMIEVRTRFTDEEIKAAWVYNTGGKRGRSQWEFHGPNGFWHHDIKMADCSYSARAGGWQKMMDRLDEEKEGNSDS